MEYIRTYWPIAFCVIQIVGIWAAWSIRHGLASKEDLSTQSDLIVQQADKVKDLEHEIELLEVQFRHMPTGSDFTTVKVELAKLCSDSTSTCNYVRNLDAAIKRIESHLLKEK